MSREYFFRNDDIRDTLDKELIDIHELFKRRKVPIIHAVEPGNVKPDVIRWLILQRQTCPEILSIMQHGYDHSIKNLQKKGEFGGQRSYQEQYDDILNGKNLMNRYFGDQWFQAFNFPYAPYNPAAIRALEDVGYLVLNSHYSCEWKRQLFYSVGHILGKGMLFDKHVSWNHRIYPGTTMYEISMNITFIKKYHNEHKDCEFYDYEFLCSEIDKYINTAYPIGLLLHHRYHTTKESVDLVDRVIDYLEAKHCRATSMEQIYGKLGKHA
jgi:peptidoglycan/xylan/chitin deacetylase (PgdA/CDA1 family)